MKYLANDPGYANVRKMPLMFAVLAAIGVGSYVAVTPLMVKQMYLGEGSIISMLLMPILAFIGVLIAGKLQRANKPKAVGWFAVFIMTALGITLCVLDAIGIIPTPGPRTSVCQNGDVLFFITTYVLSDVFSEVFGYKASRLTNMLASGFALLVCLGGKAMTYIPAPETAADAESTFLYVFGGAFYATIVGSLIYFLGDWVNDKVFVKIKNRVSSDSSFTSFSFRALSSSFCGRMVDMTLFAALVIVPFSNQAFCDKFGLICWNMPMYIIIGNVFFTTLFQVTVEIACTPISYDISQKLLKKAENIHIEISTSSEEISATS